MSRAVFGVLPRSAVRLLKPIDRLLQLILPPRKRRLCYFSRPDYCDNAYHIYRHILRTRNDVEHVWPLMDTALAPRLRAEFVEMTRAAGTHGHRLRIVRRGSLTGYWLFLTSGTVLFTHGLYPVTTHAYRGRRFVCLWHGMPLKSIGHLNRTSPRPTSVFATHHLASSHLFRYIVATAFGVHPERVLLAGLPRCDALLSGSQLAMSPAEIRRRLGLTADRRLLVWLPTYRTEGARAVVGGRFRSFLDDLAEWTLPELSKQCAAYGCELLIKLHPRDPLNHIRPVQDHPHVHWLRARDWTATGIALYDLLAISDGLLSDVSSVLIDYLARERPIGVIGFDAAAYSRDLTLPLNLVLRSEAFHHLQSPDDLEPFFDSVTRPGRHAPPAADLSVLLNETRKTSGAETITRAIGLPPKAA